MRFAEDLGQVVGRLHACSGPWFGDVLGTEKHRDGASFLHALVDSRLADAPEDLTSAGRGGVAAALHLPALDPEVGTAVRAGAGGVAGRTGVIAVAHRPGRVDDPRDGTLP